MVKDQLRDKQELIEQFESHMTALTEQHQSQHDEIQAVNDQLKVQLGDCEAQLSDRNRQLEES